MASESHYGNGYVMASDYRFASTSDGATVVFAFALGFSLGFVLESLAPPSRSFSTLHALALHTCFVILQQLPSSLIEL